MLFVSFLSHSPSLSQQMGAAKESENIKAMLDDQVMNHSDSCSQVVIKGPSQPLPWLQCPINLLGEADTCAVENYGFMDAEGKNFIKGAWSRAIAIGFNGNSKRSEQYQVTPPGCKPAQCKSQVASTSAVSALTATTCNNGKPALPPVVVSVGQSHSLALVQGGLLIGWGSDSNQRISNAPKGVTFSSISAGIRHTCVVEAESGLPKCFGETYDPKMAPPNTKFSAIAAGRYHQCGLVQVTYAVKCWARAQYELDRIKDVNGSDYLKLSSVSEANKLLAAPSGSFSSISVGWDHSCGIEKDTDLGRCWGPDKFNEQVPTLSSFS